MCIPEGELIPAFQVGQNHCRPGGPAIFVFIVVANEGRGKVQERVVEVVRGQANLFQIVAALHTACCFPSLLNRRQQQRDQDANNGNYYEEFDQGKRVPSIKHCSALEMTVGEIEPHA